MIESIIAFAIGVIAGLHVLNIVCNFHIFTGYVIGMGRYRYNNWKGKDKELKAMQKATEDEMEEFNVEAEKRNWFGMFDEANDVWHGMVQCAFFATLGVMAPIMYPLVFLLCPWSAMKQGRRYAENGCVRSSKHCEKHDHKCDRRTFGEVMAALWAEIKEQIYPN